MHQNKFLQQWHAKREEKASSKPTRPQPVESKPSTPTTTPKAEDPPAAPKLRDGYKDDQGIHHPSPAKAKQFLQHAKDCHSCADEAKALGLA